MTGPLTSSLTTYLDPLDAKNVREMQPLAISEDAIHPLNLFLLSSYYYWVYIKKLAGYVTLQMI